MVLVSGAEQVSAMCERRSGDILGNITFGVTEMYAYPKRRNIRRKGRQPEQGQDCGLAGCLSPVYPPFSLRGFNKADDVFCSELSIIFLYGRECSRGLTNNNLMI